MVYGLTLSLSVTRICVNISTVYNDTLVAKGLIREIDERCWPWTSAAASVHRGCISVQCRYLLAMSVPFRSSTTSTRWMPVVTAEVPFVRRAIVLRCSALQPANATTCLRFLPNDSSVVDRTVGDWRVAWLMWSVGFLCMIRSRSLFLLSEIESIFNSREWLGILDW